MDFYEELLIDVRKGVSGTGTLLGSLVRHLSVERPTTLEPGDLVIRDSKGNVLYKIVAPIAYDVWYLQNPVNLLSIEDPELVVISEDYLENQLSFLNDDLGEIKPLCIIRNLDDLVYRGIGYNPISRLWAQHSEYFINLMPFEIFHTGNSERYSSEGASREYGFSRNAVVGYFAFPSGQLGVMEVISIFCYSDIASLDFTVDLHPNKETQSERFFPPVDENTGKNICLGRHMVESGYLVDDENRRSVELMAEPYPEEAYEFIEGKPNFWTRYWLHGDETWPVPGDFVMILCKSLALPPHIWWFQETNPFVYAANWFETSNLTGGEITAVTLEVDRTDGGIGNLYTVKIQGREIKINSSDFKEYSVGDWVGILKVESVQTTQATQSFYWKDQVRFTSEDEDQIFDSTQYVILPIAFYNEV